MRSLRSSIQSFRPRLRRLILGSAALCLAAGLSPRASGSVIRVPFDESTITEAMVNAARGDTVLVSAGFYKEHVMLRSGVYLLSVSGPGRTTIHGSPGRPVVHIPVGGRGTGIEGFTLEGGSEGVRLEGSSGEVQDVHIKLPMDIGFLCGATGDLYVRSCEVERCTTGISVELGGRLSVLACEVAGNTTGIALNGAFNRVFRSRIVGNEVGIQIGSGGVPDVGGSKKFGNDFLGNRVAVWSMADTLLTLPFNSWGTMACDSIQAQLRGHLDFLPAVSLDRSETVDSCK